MFFKKEIKSIKADNLSTCAKLRCEVRAKSKKLKIMKIFKSILDQLARSMDPRVFFWVEAMDSHSNGNSFETIRRIIERKEFEEREARQESIEDFEKRLSKLKPQEKQKQKANFLKDYYPHGGCRIIGRNVKLCSSRRRKSFCKNGLCCASKETFLGEVFCVF